MADLVLRYCPTLPPLSTRRVYKYIVQRLCFCMQASYTSHRSQSIVMYITAASHRRKDDDGVKLLQQSKTIPSNRQLANYLACAIMAPRLTSSLWRRNTDTTINAWSMAGTWFGALIAIVGLVGVLIQL